VGCLLGSFPQHKQQNLFHTLPLLLMPEEVLLFALLPLLATRLTSTTATHHTPHHNNGPQG
jgi:hypothetical protein